ncbi:MAG: hypothetical protein E2O59_02525 [Gammaproteobacteria bacterium]|nr:MAG: hypothetical protein E2O59_02525 [Gammaproteobacteria bacterium]
MAIYNHPYSHTTEIAATIAPLRPRTKATCDQSDVSPIFSPDQPAGTSRVIISAVTADQVEIAAHVAAAIEARGGRFAQPADSGLAATAWLHPKNPLSLFKEGSPSAARKSRANAGVVATNAARTMNLQARK